VRTFTACKYVRRELAHQWDVVAYQPGGIVDASRSIVAQDLYALRNPG
jgi:hypothetical protein